MTSCYGACMARVTLSIRLTAAERQTLAARAEKDGRPLSQWVRLVALSAAGGVASEWDAEKGPPWARKISKLVARVVREELRAGKSRR